VDARERLFSGGLGAAEWRAFARWGATRLPDWWLRTSPAPIAVGIALAQPKMRAQIAAAQARILGRRAPWIAALDVARAFASFGHCLAEGFAADGSPTSRFSFDVDGAAHLDAIRARNQGAIVVTAHAGSWEVAGGGLRDQGLDVAIVMAAEANAGARAISDEARRKLGVEVLHVGDDPLAALPLLRRVRAGGFVALQIDRVPAGMKSVVGTLGGRPFALPEGPFSLARAARVPLLPVFTARLGHRRHRIELHPPIDVPLGRASIEPAVGAVCTALESFLRRHPTQWFHFVDDDAPVAERAEGLSRSPKAADVSPAFPARPRR
jgi:lauroyl/myristoyl acyltransferase